MEFIDLKAQQNKIRESLKRRVDAVFDHQKFIMGPEVQELEEKLAAFVRIKHAIAVANGTDALQIAMMALGVGPGDEVITTSFSFIATVETIVLLRAKPVFVDIDPKTFNMDPARIEEKISARTKAILPVSLYGQCADMDAINAIAKKHGVVVIEDGAQSFGALYKGRRSCGLTDLSCTSFFPSKPLGCYGDGGAIFTNHDEWARLIRQIRVHGQDRRYHHPILGVNSRLDTLQAAILLAKLEIFEEELEARDRIAARYTRLLSGKVKTPFVSEHNRSAWAQYTLRVSNREGVERKLSEAKIPTAVHYPIALHRQPVFQKLDLGAISLPHAEQAAQEVLSLPMHPYLSEADQDKIAQCVGGQA